MIVKTRFSLPDGAEEFKNAGRPWLNAGGEPPFLQKELPPPTPQLIKLLEKGIWDPLLPLDHPERRLSLGEGDTPLLQIDWDGKVLWVKNEFQNPTGSFKDRGAAIMMSRALEEGVTRVVEDSSGNAGCAVAAYAAAIGIPCTIYVPESAPPAKLRMIEAFGARLRRIPGSRQAATEAAWEATRNAWFASHVWNPWFLEGTKIFAYEVWQQTEGRMPDEIIFPCGNGTLLLGVYIGFRELRYLGLIQHIPALSAAFSENCAPLLQPEGPFKPTCADGISVTHPARRQAILQAITSTGGRLYPVPEGDILTTCRKAAHTGLFIEPTAAVALAAISQVIPGHKILIPLTGHGFKKH